MTPGLEEIDRFKDEVLADPELQQQLRSTADRRDFLLLIIRLGHERGYQFSGSDVEAALVAAHRTWLERWIG